MGRDFHTTNPGFKPLPAVLYCALFPAGTPSWYVVTPRYSFEASNIRQSSCIPEIPVRLISGHATYFCYSACDTHGYHAMLSAFHKSLLKAIIIPHFLGTASRIIRAAVPIEKSESVSVSVIRIYSSYKSPTWYAVRWDACRGNPRFLWRDDRKPYCLSFV